jgi:carbonic anhydrase/acetyltransferase-like protein (isoleucine patch superfamily)
MPSPKTGKIPEIHDSVYIAPNAVVIGNVTIDEGSNIWFGAVLRGDQGEIIIGKRTSVQEHVTIHNEEGTSVKIGDDCIIGHHAMIHGPSIIEDGCVIGIGSNVLHNTKVGTGSMIGAGAVLVNKEIPPRSLAVGVPAKLKKQFPENEDLVGTRTAGSYQENGQKFKKFFAENPEILKS